VDGKSIERWSEKLGAEVEMFNRAEFGRARLSGDGAHWIWKIVFQLFPSAIQIVDLYHAREHYWKVANEAFGGNEIKKRAWTHVQKEHLDAGRPDLVAEAI
jgi:hypothetical protein